MSTHIMERKIFKIEKKKLQKCTLHFIFWVYALNSYGTAVGHDIPTRKYLYNIIMLCFYGRYDIRKTDYFKDNVRLEILYTIIPDIDDITDIILLVYKRLISST